MSRIKQPVYGRGGIAGSQPLCDKPEKALGNARLALSSHPGSARRAREAGAADIEKCGRH
jgi:hypothetical protein